MKKIIAFILAIMAVLTLMFAEYRYIMVNIKPYRCDNGTVYLEIFDRVDEYYADKWEHRNLVPIANVEED